MTVKIQHYSAIHYDSKKYRIMVKIHDSKKYMIIVQHIMTVKNTGL